MTARFRLNGKEWARLWSVVRGQGIVLDSTKTSHERLAALWQPRPFSAAPVRHGEEHRAAKTVRGDTVNSSHHSNNICTDYVYNILSAEDGEGRGGEQEPGGGMWRRGSQGAGFLVQPWPLHLPISPSPPSSPYAYQPLTVPLSTLLSPSPA